MSLELTDLLAAAVTVYGLGGALSILLPARQMVVRGASCDESLRRLTLSLARGGLFALDQRLPG